MQTNYLLTTCTWISHFTYSFCCTTLKNATAYTSSQKLLNKPAMHVVISLLVQSRKFWWYLLLAVFFEDDPRRHNDVMTSLSVYLLTVPVNLVYVKLWSLATKIRFWSKTCMIQPRRIHSVGFFNDTSSTACELTMLLLSLSLTFNVTCLTVASFITLARFLWWHNQQTVRGLWTQQCSGCSVWLAHLSKHTSVCSMLSRMFSDVQILHWHLQKAEVVSCPPF